ncbi:MAG TPA: hypothetical protein VM223_00945 [Planctomycetota bacterium]|nr:hypothetical protein [Planctomycetota bacterium]
MATSMVSREQRLRTLENRIRKNFESFVQTGMDLKEIRDDELFKEDGFEKWEHYLKQRVGEDFGIEKSQVRRLIQCAEIRPKLPDMENHPRAGDSPGWSQTAVLEFGRLVPDRDDDARKKDYAALRKNDAARVAKAAVKLAEEEAAAKGKDSEAVAVTSMHVRKAVDADLGINRAEKARETKRQREDAGKKLEDYLRSRIGLIEGISENLTEVPEDSWKLLEESEPGLAECLATACDDLAELLRS